MKKDTPPALRRSISSSAYLLLSPSLPPHPFLVDDSSHGLSSRIAKPLRTSSSVITSGGMDHSVSVAHVRISSSRSRVAVTIGVGTRVSCNPRINPGRGPRGLGPGIVSTDLGSRAGTRSLSAVRPAGAKVPISARRCNAPTGMQVGSRQTSCHDRL